MSVLSKLRKFLGVLTDLLLIGRGKGWWSKKTDPADAFRKELRRRP